MPLPRSFARSGIALMDVEALGGLRPAFTTTIPAAAAVILRG